MPIWDFPFKTCCDITSFVIIIIIFLEIRNIVELVPWKQLVEVRLIALPASIPWLASCSPCLSVYSTLPTGTHTFMPKNPLTGTITCSKVSLGYCFVHFFSYVFIMRSSVEIFSEPQNSKEKSQLSRLKRKCNFLLCTHFSIFLVKVSLEYFWPQNTYGQKYIFFHALHTHDVWKHCKKSQFCKN